MYMFYNIANTMLQTEALPVRQKPPTGENKDSRAEGRN